MLSVAVVVILFTIFGPTLYMLELQSAIRPATILESSSAHLEVPHLVEVVDLSHESMFAAAIKSCLPPDQKCKTFIAEPPAHSKPIQRVALIAPPGDISSALLNHAEEVMHQHNRHHPDQPIEIIPRSSVPPYGYGKTHGLTKIIRLVPQPLLLEVTDALQSVLEPGESHRDVTIDDIKAALRQVLRFHCRLSHVAAHTAILSIGFMDLVQNPASVTERLETFLAPDDHAKNPGEEDDAMLEFMPDDDRGGLFDAQESYGTQMLTYLQSATDQEIGRLLDDVLLEEMALTKNLTLWPCPSFWAAGEASSKTKLSSITQRIAKALIPDCSDPFATCFVERDKCEAKGDAECAGNKR